MKNKPKYRVWFKLKGQRNYEPDTWICERYRGSLGNSAKERELYISLNTEVEKTQIRKEK